MRVLAGSLKMSLVLLVPQRGGPTPAFAHVLKLCRGTTVRCASLAPSVPAAIKLARATVKNRPLVAVYVSKPAMLAPLASLNALRRHILLIAPLYKTFNDQLWGSVIAAAAASPAIDLAVAPVSTVGSPSVQRFGAALSTSGSTAGAGPDVTAPSAPSVSVVGVTASSAGVWWLPSVDDVGVTAYRLYVGGALFDGHGTSPETIGNLPCGVPVTIGVDAVDAAGNASAQSLGDSDARSLRRRDRAGNSAGRHNSTFDTCRRLRLRGQPISGDAVLVGVHRRRRRRRLPALP